MKVLKPQGPGEASAIAFVAKSQDALIGTDLARRVLNLPGHSQHCLHRWASRQALLSLYCKTAAAGPQAFSLFQNASTELAAVSGGVLTQSNLPVAVIGRELRHDGAKGLSRAGLPGRLPARNSAGCLGRPSSD